MLSRLVLLPDERHLVGVGGGVAVDAVDAGVQPPVLEPPEGAGRHVAVHGPAEVSGPRQAGPGLLSPELAGVLHTVPVW